MKTIDTSLPETIQLEKFNPAELTTLREELMRSGLDSWQAGELISSFLTVRGYGISSKDARCAASRIESVGCSIQCIQEEFDRVALFM